MTPVIHVSTWGSHWGLGWPYQLGPAGYELPTEEWRALEAWWGRARDELRYDVGQALTLRGLLEQFDRWASQAVRRCGPPPVSFEVHRQGTFLRRVERLSAGTRRVG